MVTVSTIDPRGERGCRHRARCPARGPLLDPGHRGVLRTNTARVGACSTPCITRQARRHLCARKHERQLSRKHAREEALLGEQDAAPTTPTTRKNRRASPRSGGLWRTSRLAGGQSIVTRINKNKICEGKDFKRACLSPLPTNLPPIPRTVQTMRAQRRAAPASSEEDQCSLRSSARKRTFHPKRCSATPPPLPNPRHMHTSSPAHPVRPPRDADKNHNSILSLSHTHTHTNNGWKKLTLYPSSFC